MTTSPAPAEPSARTRLQRVPTGVRNLDGLVEGGLPRGSLVVLAGPPGSGKTVLAQQLAFHNATPEGKALIFGTLSEPTAKTLRYVSQFGFFRPGAVGESVEIVDLGAILRSHGLERAGQLVMEHVRRVGPSIVVVDSFKVFDDLAGGAEEMRKFGYQIAINLMAWEATTLLLGEYRDEDLGTSPLFSIADAIITVDQRLAFGQQQRFLRVVKMRGTAHDRLEHSFTIGAAGAHLYAPRATIRREPRPVPPSRRATGIARLDELVVEGIPSGSTVLVSGAAGTGKTLLLLELLQRGAEAGERGILFSFEETAERLLSTAATLGWDLAGAIARGVVEVVFIPQPDIDVERDLELIHDRVVASGAQRVAIDSLSVFLHRIDDPEVCREKTFQLATIVHNAGAIGLFAVDIPYGSGKISRFGVEETVVDGVILMSSAAEGLERRRYIEIYKMRNTAHLEGRHAVLIGPHGLEMFPRYEHDAAFDASPPLESTRMPTGVPGLDDLMGGGVLARSVTLLAGSAGTGKTAFGLQFLLAGVAIGEAGLFVTLEECAEQLAFGAASLGLPLAAAQAAGLVCIADLRRERTRRDQFLSVITDRVAALGAKRVVLDGFGQLATEGTSRDERRQVLSNLAHRFKVLGVTSLLTLEASSLTSNAAATEHGLSPSADNLVVLRYRGEPGAQAPVLTVLKTRGSAHERGTYEVDLGPGGARIGAPSSPTPAVSGSGDDVP